MPDAFLPPPSRPNGLQRLIAHLLGMALWLVLAALALFLAAAVALWLLGVTLFGVVAGMITGRPAPVAVLWRNWRQAAQRRWPTRPHAGCGTQGHASHPSRTAAEGAVQDVEWREVADAPSATAPAAPRRP